LAVNRALHRVLDVVGGDLAVHRGHELHAAPELHRDLLVVGGDLGRALGEVGHGCVRIVWLEGVKRPVHRILHGVTEGVVRLARVHVVHVRRRQEGDLATLLALDRRAARLIAAVRSGALV